MNKLLAYCRAGYESDAANELTEQTANQQVYGYPQFTPGAGYIIFNCQHETDADKIGLSLPVAKTVFLRQLVVVTDELVDLDRSDRLGPIIQAVQRADTDAWINGRLFVEHADTDEGKELAKFCRKFTVPLRQALRKNQCLTFKEKPLSRGVHIFFTSFDSCLVGYTYPQCRSQFDNGICRLKFPPSAPSRSTLKLEEAILTMLNTSQQERVFRIGSRAVDLGACPGGWTYQLVERGMHVEAIDNGAIDEILMASGQVEHYAADGFTYKPKFGRVDLLVCDMIEQPDRVAKLMGDWLVKGWAEHAVFNLKLPMKRRYETVMNAIDGIKVRLANTNNDYEIHARHLYHDRDEVTVSVIKG